MENTNKIRTIENIVETVWNEENVFWRNTTLNICNQQMVIREEKDKIIVYLDTSKMAATPQKMEKAINRLNEELKKEFEIEKEKSQYSFRVITLKLK